MKAKMRKPKARPDQLEALFVAAEYFEEQGELRNAFDCLLAGAQGGHLFCQETVAIAYSEGQGVRKNAAQAAFWYRRAYDNARKHGILGCAAAHNYGIDLYRAGKFAQATQWFEKARAQKDGSALIWLAKIQIEHRGTRGRKKAAALLNEALALQLYVEISEGDHEQATALLAKLNGGK